METQKGMHQEDLENILLSVYPLEILITLRMFFITFGLVYHSVNQKINLNFKNTTKNVFDSQSLAVGKIESDVRFLPWYFDKLVSSCMKN